MDLCENHQDIDKREEVKEEEKCPSKQASITDMKLLFPKKRILNPKEMLYPVGDENSKDDYINRRTYRNTFTKAHKAMQEMSMDNKIHKGSKYMSRRKLLEVVDDIKAYRSGRYIAI